MKRTWIPSIFAAVVFSTAAHAQEMKASIPFDFKAQGRTMPAGNYTVKELKVLGNSALAFRNENTREAAVLIASISQVTGDTSQSVITFECRSGACMVAEIQNAAGLKRIFPLPRHKGASGERTAVRLTPAIAGAAGY